VRLVRDALVRLHDLPYLETHPLADPGAPAAPRPDGVVPRALRPGLALHHRLLQAIEAVRPPGPPGGPAWERAARRHRLLALRYGEALPVAEVQRRLAISASEYFREHRLGLAALAAALGDDGAARVAPAPAGPARGSPAAGAPPAAPGPGTRTNLPAPLTGLVGRGRELAAVAAALAGARLVTLTGAGGCGKTRLALEAAARARAAYPDGVWLVELAPLADPAHVPQAVAGALGVQEEPGRPLPATLVATLAPGRALLVLDNCEHLAGGVAALAGRLLRACPELRILATSRAPLHVYGEQELPVPPLDLPDPDRLPAAGALARVPAVALFVQRARAVRPGLSLTEEGLREVAELCRRLDGLPLAIELAAARSKLFSPRAMLARLAGAGGGPPLHLLERRSRDLPARQQTMRDAVAWSHDLLTGEQQAVFRRLAVFAGGCTVEAAAAVAGATAPPGSRCRGTQGGTTPQDPRGRSLPATGGGAEPRGAGGGGPPSGVVLALEALVDNSLLKQDEQADGEPRFSLLETVRAFGLERLAAGGELAAARDAHAAHFLRLAEAAEPHLGGAQQEAWLDALTREHDNVRAALRWLLERGDGRRGLRLGTALGRAWEQLGLASEGRDWLRRLLALPPPGERDARAAWDAVRGRALAAAGALAYEQDDYPAAEAAYGESLRLSRALGDRRGVATALCGLADARRFRPLAEQRNALYEEALAIWRDLGDGERVASTLYLLGTAAGFFAGEHARAGALFEESAAIRRRLGDRRGLAWSLHLLGVMELRLGHLDGALRIFEEGLAARRALGDRLGAAYSLGRIGQVALLRGEYAAARAPLAEALGILHEFGDRWQLASALDYTAQLLIGLGRPAAGLRLAGAAQRVRDDIGAAVPEPDRERHDAPLAAARAATGALGDDAWRAGRRLTLSEAVEAALAASAAAVAAAEAGETAPPVAPPQSDAGGPGRLTRREREVAALIARGLTNRAIAATLGISERTVDTHVERILGKLGARRRAQIAAWAVAQPPPEQRSVPAVRLLPDAAGAGPEQAGATEPTAAEEARGP
jgi:predicted ATPase/DNA-binding CsgD family transcriptional regulator